MAMNKYGRATKMTSPPPGMPAGMAKRYAEVEGQISNIATMNKDIVEGRTLSSKGYDPNEMFEIEDTKTGKKTKVPYGSYEHQMYVAGPPRAEHFMGIGTKDAGVQRFRDKDVEAFNNDPQRFKENAGLKTTELRFSKGSTGYNPKTGEVNASNFYQQDYEKPIKGVTDLPSRYKRENEILISYNKEKDKLSAMDKEWEEMNKPMPIRPIKRDLPKLQGKISSIPGETTWNDPKAEKYKTKREIVKRREGGQDQKINISSKKIGERGSSIRTSKTVETVGDAKGIRYNREQKMAKAFYAPESVVGAGDYSSKTDDTIDDQGYSKDISKGIKSDVKKIRGEKKQYKTESRAGGKPLSDNSRDVVGEYNKAIKTAKLASRYAKRADISASGVEGKWREGEGSKLKYFTPDYEKYSSKKVEGAMSGYVESGKQERSRMNHLQMEQVYQVYPHSKTAEQNVVNRNSTSDRMKKFWGY